MKIAYTSILFLQVVGILNLVIAGGVIPLNSGGTVPDYVYVLGYTNTTVDDIMKFDKNLCDKNGGPNAYAAYNQSFQQFVACVNTLTDELTEEIRNYSPRLQPYGSSGVLKGFCLQVPQYENCVKPLTNSMQTCLDPEKQGSADFLYNTTSRVLRFVCEDDAARLIEFYSRKDDPCFKSKSSVLKECLSQTITKYIHETVSEGAELAGLGILNLLLPNLEKCNVFAKFQHCVIDELKACHGHPAGDLFNSVLNIVKGTAKCDSFFESHAVTSPGSDLHPGN